MSKLQTVLENKRDQYMIRVLEEGTSELGSLKTKQYLTENLNLINKILVEESVVDGARAHLANNWGKYAVGGAALGAAGAAGLGDGVVNAYQDGSEGGVINGLKSFAAGDGYSTGADGGVIQGLKSAGNQMGDNFSQMGDKLTQAGNEAVNGYNFGTNEYIPDVLKNGLASYDQVSPGAAGIYAGEAVRSVQDNPYVAGGAAALGVGAGALAMNRARR